jgi:hypothetical protein
MLIPKVIICFLFLSTKGATSFTLFLAPKFNNSLNITKILFLHQYNLQIPVY